MTVKKRTWLNTAEVAKMMSISTVTVRRWTDSGKLECTRTAGGHRRYRYSMIKAYAAEMFTEKSSSKEEETANVVENSYDAKFYNQVNIANTVLKLNISITKALLAIEQELDRVNEVMCSTADIAYIAESLPDEQRGQLKNYINNVFESLQYHDLFTQRLGVVNTSLQNINTVFSMSLAELNESQRKGFSDELKKNNTIIDPGILSNFLNNLLCDDKPELDIISAQAKNSENTEIFN